MKNIANYLDEFIDDDLNECCCKKIKRSINKDLMKTFKKGSKENEIKKDKSKYKKEKYKNQI